MRGIVRLIDALLRGDSSALYILGFAVAGTLLIYLAAEYVQHRRRQRRRAGDRRDDM